MASTDENKREGLLDSPAVSEWIKIPERTLDQWAYRGVGPAFIKVGRHRRYRAEDVERWLDSLTHGGSS